MAKTAVVLAGGGSRGAYQIGVWRAMKELGISWDIVTGASVGALNGALMVQGDYDVAQSLWENITSKEVMRDVLDEEKLPSLDDRTVWRTFIKDALRQGGADISPLEDMIRRLVDEEKLRASPVDFALITVEYPSMKPLELRKGDIPKGMVAEYLLASAACFPAFKIKEIGDAQYIDGGYYDNLPINLAIDMGAEVVIAVDLHSVGLTRRVKAGAYQITTIQPRWPLGPFILFEKGTAQRNMALGYLAAWPGGCMPFPPKAASPTPAGCTRRRQNWQPKPVPTSRGCALLWKSCCAAAFTGISAAKTNKRSPLP